MSFLAKKDKESATKEKISKKIKIGKTELECSYNQEVFINVFCAVVYLVVFLFSEALSVRYYTGNEIWVTFASASNGIMVLLAVVAFVSSLALGVISSIRNIQFNNLKDLFKLLFSASVAGQIYLGISHCKESIASFWADGTYNQYILQADGEYTELLKATSAVEPALGTYVMLLLVFLVLFTNARREG